MFGHGGENGSRLRAMVDACPDPIVLLAPVLDNSGTVQDFTYVEANAIACEHNRKPYDVLIGMRLLSLLPEQRDSGFFEHYVKVCESGKAMMVRDHVYDEHPSSPQAQHYDTYIARCDGGILVTWRDVTQRHWAEQALLRTNEKLRVAREAEEAAKQSAGDFLRTAQHFKLLAENASDVVYETDTDGTIHWISPSVHEALGYLPEQLVGTKEVDLVHEEDRERIAEPRRSVYLGQDVVSMQVRFPTVDGDVRWMAVTAHPLRDDHDGIRGSVVGLHDVTSERRIAHMLETSERIFRSAMDAAPHGMALADMTDRITTANPSLVDLLGTTMGELVGQPIGAFVYPVEPGKPMCVQRIMASGEDRVLQHRHRVLSNRGAAVVEHSVSLVRDKQGTPQFYVHQMVDVTEATATEAGLREQAQHDLLTGALNRAGLLNRLADWQPENTERDECIALLYCDVDGLKAINDIHGHAVGDEILRTAATRIDSAVRRGDLVARVGGDEFIVAMDRVLSLDVALEIAEKVRAAVDKPVIVAGNAFELQISVGVALNDQRESLEALTSRADAALYRAKRSGRNCVRV